MSLPSQRRGEPEEGTPEREGLRRMIGSACPLVSDAAGCRGIAGDVPAPGGEAGPWTQGGPAAARAAALVPLAAAGAGGLGLGALALWGGAGLIPGLILGLGTCAAAGLIAVRLRHLARERAALEARLRAAQAAQARAEAESRAKSLFLAEMSHELRTPLNTVMGFSEMMAQEMLGPHKIPAYAGYARDILASGRHLLSLADDLLDLARIEAGHRVLLETPVRLDLVSADVIAMMRPQARARDLLLSREGAGTAQIWGDARAVRQMALNLLANACKFTPPGGAVRLVCGIDAAGAPFLAVEDTGPGVDGDELPLPGPHHRESRTDVATGRGAGLGLAIVRGLAELHGATFTLARRAGGGTRAAVAFPASRALP